MEESREKKKKQLLNQSNNYIKYSALAFQMFAIIGIFTFIGYKIDESRTGKTPLFTAFLSVFGVAAALYLVFKGLNKNKE